MDAQIIVTWVTQNGFHSLDSGRYRRCDAARTITIEIKKMSIVLIDERPGLQPRLVSRLFKDMRPESARLDRLLPEG